jgi:hypothetical protein
LEGERKKNVIPVRHIDLIYFHFENSSAPRIVPGQDLGLGRRLWIRWAATRRRGGGSARPVVESGAARDGGGGAASATGERWAGLEGSEPEGRQSQKRAWWSLRRGDVGAEREVEARGRRRAL